MPILHEVQLRLGYQFQDQTRLETALTHSSASEATQPRRGEQLEFLGDAVVGLAVSELLLLRYPDCTEGQLSKYRAALVNTTSLAAKSRVLGLNQALLLGKGEEKTGGRDKASILAALYEATLGAIFLESGYAAARAVVQRHFELDISEVQSHSVDPKTELQELCQSMFRSAPHYRLVSQSGPDHERRFVIDVLLNSTILARGEGHSKRIAEQDAAKRALSLGVGVLNMAQAGLS